MRYAVVMEKANGNYSGYVPDLPGCVATGATLREVEQNNWKTSRLEKGAEHAHQLAVALRAKGYEAYEFHDRTSSVVTAWPSIVIVRSPSG